MISEEKPSDNKHLLFPFKMIQFVTLFFMVNLIGIINFGQLISQFNINTTINRDKLCSAKEKLSVF